MIVKKWMTPDPITINATQTLADARQVFQQHSFKRLPVVDNKGQLVGIISDRDMKEAAPSDASTLSVYELNYLNDKIRVSEIMTSPVLTVETEDSVEKAAEIMHERKVSGLPVFENGKLAGIITVGNVLEAFITLAKVSQPQIPGLAALSQEEYQAGSSASN